MTETPSAPRLKTPARQNSSERVRAWQGPAILSYGYRPFFLLAGMWAALAMGIWVLVLSGAIELPSRFDPVSWHAHEFLFGYLGAVMAGFLLTAVPNWTGRLPIVGWPLAGLVALWLIGRLAVGLSVFLPAAGVAVLDLSFPLVFAALIAREIIKGRNWRNLVILLVLIVFLVANGLFHFAALDGGFAAGSFAFRLGLGAAVMLLGLIGGRIVPSFTRNWLVKRGAGARPAPMGGFDRATLALGAAALAVWSVLPAHPATGLLAMLAGIAHLLRLSRWSGRHTGAEPLVWILHVAYVFIPLGFVAISLSIFGVDLSPRIGAQHFWMAGAIGVMTLAVMTRASLGHAGRALHATGAVTAVYGLILLAVIARFVAALEISPAWVLDLSAGAWIAAFSLFCIAYWPILTHRRP